MGGLRLPICVRCGVPAKSRILWGVSKMLTINLNDVAKELRIK